MMPASFMKEQTMAVISMIAEAGGGKRALAQSVTVEFEVKRRLKLWVVLRDDIYSGSYPEQVSAAMAAEREIKAIIKAGGKAEMRAATAES